MLRQITIENVTSYNITLVVNIFYQLPTWVIIVRNQIMFMSIVRYKMAINVNFFPVCKLFARN